MLYIWSVWCLYDVYMSSQSILQSIRLLSSRSRTWQQPGRVAIQTPQVFPHVSLQTSVFGISAVAIHERTPHVRCVMCWDNMYTYVYILYHIMYTTSLDLKLPEVRQCHFWWQSAKICPEFFSQALWLAAGSPSLNLKRTPRTLCGMVIAMPCYALLCLAMPHHLRRLRLSGDQQDRQHFLGSNVIPMLPKRHFVDRHRLVFPALRYNFSRNSCSFFQPSPKVPAVTKVVITSVHWKDGQSTFMWHRRDASMLT